MAKKRANGEGNIRKRKDGRWEGRYTAGYDETTGKRLIKNVLGKTQAEVKEKLARAITEAETLDTRRSDEYTLGTWLQTWYELYAKPHLRFSTAEYYRRGIEILRMEFSVFGRVISGLPALFRPVSFFSGISPMRGTMCSSMPRR